MVTTPSASVRCFTSKKGEILRDRVVDVKHLPLLELEDGDGRGDLGHGPPVVDRVLCGWDVPRSVSKPESLTENDPLVFNDDQR